MIWFCGGHGACLTGAGPGRATSRAVIAWMKRYLAGDSRSTPGPGFEWLADDAQWRSAAAFPPPAGAPLVGRGLRHAAVNPADAASGTPVAAGPRRQRGQRRRPGAAGATQVVGEPS